MHTYTYCTIQQCLSSIYNAARVYMHQGSAHTGRAGVAGRPQTPQTHAAIFTTTQAVFVPPLPSQR